jgi:hypothetical protein
MDGYIVRTEAGYSVYIGAIAVADVDGYAAALDALESCGLPWNGRVERRTAPTVQSW